MTYTAPLTRLFDKQSFTLQSNKFGINSSKASKMKSTLKSKGHNVRTVINKTLPYVYPEGRYFIYSIKTSKSNKKMTDALKRAIIIKAIKDRRTSLFGGFAIVHKTIEKLKRKGYKFAKLQELRNLQVVYKNKNYDVSFFKTDQPKDIISINEFPGDLTKPIFHGVLDLNKTYLMTPKKQK